MEHNCANCDQIISGNFCGNCGQKKYKRIDRKYIFDEVQYTVLHTNKGFLYSLKNILKNPGKTAKEFIDGNRVNHYKPLLLAFVLSSVSGFISYKVIGLSAIMREYYAGRQLNSEFMGDLVSVMASYNSAIMLVLVPFFAVFTKLALRKWGHNYFEHIIMNCYILSFYTVLSIVIVYPIIYLFRSDVENFVLITNGSMLSIPFILTWFYKGFYSEKPITSVIGKVFITIGLMLLGYLVFLIIAIAVVFLWALINGPEANKYLQSWQIHCRAGWPVGLGMCCVC